MEAFCSSCDSLQAVEPVPDAPVANTVFCAACGDEFVVSDSGDKGGRYSFYKVAKVLSVEALPKQKDLKKVVVDVRGDGDEESAVVVVTNAKYVEPDWLVVVALENAVVPAGAVVGEDPDAVQVKPTSVGGIKSYGMLCDCAMLGWTGGAKGLVQQLPAGQFNPGDSPPDSRPRL